MSVAGLTQCLVQNISLNPIVFWYKSCWDYKEGKLFLELLGFFFLVCPLHVEIPGQGSNRCPAATPAAAVTMPDP